MVTLGSPQHWNVFSKRQRFIERMDRRRAPIMVRMPVVTSEAERKKWFGMPPSKLAADVRRGGPVVF